MASTRARVSRAAAVLLPTLAVAFVGASPALAVGSSGATLAEMSTGNALAVFVGIPVAVAAAITLLVVAPGWTRDGRADSSGVWTGDPLQLGGGASAPALGSAEAAATDTASGIDATDDAAGGGASARW